MEVPLRRPDVSSKREGLRSKVDFMMTGDMSAELMRLVDKNKRLTDFIKDVAGINVELLQLCFNAEDHPDAKRELDRLTSLVHAIQYELEEGILIDKVESEDRHKDKRQHLDEGTAQDAVDIVQESIERKPLIMEKITTSEISRKRDVQTNSDKEGLVLEHYESTKGQRAVVVDGFRFRIQRQQKMTTKWRCIRPDCKARCVTDLDLTQVLRGHLVHNHGMERDNEGIMKIQTKERWCKRRALLEPGEKPGKIINNKKGVLFGLLPKDYNKNIRLRQAIYRQQDKQEEEKVPETDVVVNKRKRKTGNQDNQSDSNRNKNRSRKRFVRRKKGIDKNVEVNMSKLKTAAKGPFMCERCGKMFKSKLTLHCHYRLHRQKDANLSHSCNVCGKRFNLKTTLTAHMKFHSSQKNFQCSYCGKCFIRRDILFFHTRTHTGEQPHQCGVCHRSFSLLCNLRRHEKIHTGEKPWKCGHCGRCFNQSDILKKHIRTHTREKFNCSLCNESFVRRSQYYIHSLQVHSQDIGHQASDKMYTCMFCQKHFMHQASLTHHVASHTGDKPFQCSYCFKEFSRKAQLEIHTRTHTGFKPYKCTLCDKTFIRSAALQVHQNVHSGRVYKCSVCNREFNNPSNLTRHKRNHSGSKNFKCQVCYREFSQKVTLDLHMWTHTPEKRFKCVVCGKGYNDKRNLMSHSKTHNSPTYQQTPILQPPPLLTAHNVVRNAPPPALMQDSQPLALLQDRKPVIAYNYNQTVALVTKD